MQRRLIVPLVCLVLGVALLAVTAFVALREQRPGAPAPSAVGGAFALIDHDGKRYPILPKWQRAKAADTEGGEA